MKLLKSTSTWKVPEKSDAPQDAPQVNWYDQVDLGTIEPELADKNCFLINLGPLAGAMIAIDFGVTIIDDNLDAPQQTINVTLIDWEGVEDIEPYKEEFMKAAKSIAYDMMQNGAFIIRDKE